MTRYTTTTIPVSPASDTVWARMRSMRPAKRRELPMASATATGSRRDRHDQRRVVRPPPQQPQAQRHQQRLDADARMAHPNHCMRWRSTTGRARVATLRAEQTRSPRPRRLDGEGPQRQRRTARPQGHADTGARPGSRPR